MYLHDWEGRTGDGKRERDSEKEGTRRRLLSLVCAYCKYTIRENGTYSNEALHIHGVRHTRANLIHLHTLTLVRCPSPAASLPSPNLSSVFSPTPLAPPSCNFLPSPSLFFLPVYARTWTFSPLLPSTRSIMHCQYLPGPAQSVRSSTSTFKVSNVMVYVRRVSSYSKCVSYFFFAFHTRFLIRFLTGVVSVLILMSDYVLFA